MKNLRALILLFTANSISGISQGMSMIAIPWYFADTLQRPELFGRIYLLVTMVSLIWGIYAGTLVDKYSRKRLFMLENLSGAIVFLLAAAYGFAYQDLPTVLVAFCFAATFWIYNLHYPTLYAFAQEIIEKKHYSKISSWIEVQGQLTSMLAGGVAAILLSGIEKGTGNFMGLSINMPFAIEAWPLWKIFLVDGVTYTLSFCLIAFITYIPTVVRRKETGNMVDRLKVGIQFLKANPLIFVFGNAAYFIFVTIMVCNYLVMPNHIKNALGGDGNAYALSEMFYALGALGAALSIRLLFQKSTTVFGNIALTILGAIALVLIGLNQSLFWIYILLFFLAVANSGSRIMRVIYIFTHIPNQVIGRVNSVFFVFNVIFRMTFISLFSLSFFTERTHLSFYILGVCAFLAALILIAFYQKLITIKIDNSWKGEV